MTTAVLLSGGVDSSVALWKLREAGVRDLRAFYLKIWLEDDAQFLGVCPWEEDLTYARAVTDKLQIPLEIVPLQSEYWDLVVADAVESLKRGETPSPDLLCNQRIKFGAFLKLVGKGCERIASGHYATVIDDAAGRHLIRGVDPVKDQTYFLSQMSPEQLKRCVFPLGEFYKHQVRSMAQLADLPNKDRPDSQGICFLGKIKFRDFVMYHLGKKTGAIVDRTTGKKIGQHDGYWFHTIGQRKGLGLSGGPWFVVEKDVENNIVWVSHDENDSLLCDHFEIHHTNWLEAHPPEDFGQSYTCKLRHGPALATCRLEKIGNDDMTRYRVMLDRGDRGVASGQYCVIYKDNVCLGSGVIRRDAESLRFAAPVLTPCETVGRSTPAH